MNRLYTKHGENAWHIAERLQEYQVSAKTWDLVCMPLLPTTCEKRKILCLQNTMAGTNRMHNPIFKQEIRRGDWWIRIISQHCQMCSVRPYQLENSSFWQTLFPLGPLGRPGKPGGSRQGPISTVFISFDMLKLRQIFESLWRYFLSFIGRVCIHLQPNSPIPPSYQIRDNGQSSFISSSFQLQYALQCFSLYILVYSGPLLL